MGLSSAADPGRGDAGKGHQGGADFGDDRRDERGLPVSLLHNRGRV